jgi:hypothetical protein
MYSTLTSPEFPATKQAFDDLFLWTAIVVLLIMGPLEILIACTAFNTDVYNNIFVPTQKEQVHKPVLYDESTVPTLRI